MQIIHYRNTQYMFNQWIKRDNTINASKETTGIILTKFQCTGSKQPQQYIQNSTIPTSYPYKIQGIRKSRNGVEISRLQDIRLIDNMRYFFFQKKTANRSLSSCKVPLLMNPTV